MILKISSFLIFENINIKKERDFMLLVIQIQNIFNKKSLMNKAFNYCTHDETRTHTDLRPLPPQSSMSTNSTTCV